MKGGSLDHAYLSVRHLADRIRYKNTANFYAEFPTEEDRMLHPNLLRARIANLMEDLSVVLEDIEYCDSGDMDPDIWEETARKFLEQRNG